jgi:hypothetical protein
MVHIALCPNFRDGMCSCAGKMYIQDKVEEYSDEVFDLLDKGVSHLHDHCSTVIFLIKKGSPARPCVTLTKKEDGDAFSACFTLLACLRAPAAMCRL